MDCKHQSAPNKSMSHGARGVGWRRKPREGKYDPQTMPKLPYPPLWPPLMQVRLTLAAPNSGAIWRQIALIQASKKQLSAPATVESPVAPERHHFGDRSVAHRIN